MKRAIIWIFVFLLCLNIGIANPYITTTNPPLNNTAENNNIIIRFQTPDLYDFGNSTGMVLYEQGVAKVGLEYVCGFTEDTIPACFGTQTGVSVVTDHAISGSNSIKFSGASYELLYNPASTIINLTVETFAATNITTAGNTPSLNIYTVPASDNKEMLWPGPAGTNNIQIDIDPADTRTNTRITINKDSQGSKKWTWAKIVLEEGTYFILGNNWTAVDNGTQIVTSTGYSDRVQLGASGNSIFYLDNIRIYNQSPTINSTASVHAFKPVTFGSSITSINAFWYSNNATGVEVLFNCGNSTPNQKVTTNDTALSCTNAGSQQLVIWVNLTSSNVNVTYVNVTINADTTPDTTAPVINYYNLTSSTNGCENWNTDKNTACSTSSVILTVQFNTSENAWCAVAGSSSSTSLNINYTAIGSSRNCTGAAAGEGTREHFCTLTNQDELVYDTSYLFISCKDANNNQNRTSTSGALKVSVTSLESDGRNSIGLGIQNALLSGYTNYTDLQIYARNLSNTQVRGTFDRAAKKGSKMWAFNRIGVSDSHVNMFNLTPVLYVREFANITSSQITLQVELMINATK